MVILYDLVLRGRVWKTLSCMFKIRGKIYTDRLELWLLYI